MPMSNCHASQSIDRRHCRRLIMRRSSSRLVCQTRASFKFNLVLHNFRLTAQCDENLSALFWYAGRGGLTVELDTLNACLCCGGTSLRCKFSEILCPPGEILLRDFMNEFTAGNINFVAESSPSCAV